MLLIMCLVSFTVQVCGQTQNIIDSLLIEQGKASSKDKFDILLEISSNYNESDPTLALHRNFLSDKTQ